VSPLFENDAEEESYYAEKFNQIKNKRQKKEKCVAHYDDLLQQFSNYDVDVNAFIEYHQSQ